MKGVDSLGMTVVNRGTIGKEEAAIRNDIFFFLKNYGRIAASSFPI
jgi:hypothetical protein